MTTRFASVVAGVAALAVAASTHAAQISFLNATQTSLYQGTSFPASNAIDGDFNDFSHTDSSDAAPVMTITLTSPSVIGEIDLHNRAGCCGERLRDITVNVYDSGNNLLATSGVLNPANALGFSGSETAGTATTLGTQDLAYVLPVRVTGSYFTISRDTTGNVANDDGRVLALGEVVAFTTPEPASLGLLGFAGLGLLARRRRA